MKIECKKSFSKDDLTRKIDHILFTEWDPIGVSSLSEYDCSDEYHQYLPTIVEMVRNGDSFAEEFYAAWSKETGVSKRRVEFEQHDPRAQGEA